MFRVVAIMINWNGGSLAVESALSIINQTIQPTLVVIDNGSVDGSADAIQSISPEVRVIRNPTNLGYAAANNQALRLPTDAECILLVNNDVILPDPDSLAKVIDYLHSHPEVKGVCGRYEFPSGGFQACHRQLPTMFVMSAVWGFCRHLPGLLSSRKIRDYFLQDSDPTKPFTLERPSFSCVLLRRDCMLAIGLMDEQFPIFFNDDDYCWRWRKQGWNWLYLPDWRIVHHHNSATSRMGDLAWVEGFVSAVRFAKKHFSTISAALIRMAIVLEAAYRKHYHGDLVPASTVAIWRGDFSFLAVTHSVPNSMPVITGSSSPEKLSESCDSQNKGMTSHVG